jgi:hypothetical protein
MSKNRIKKLRNITVNGHEYKWMVDFTGSEKRLRIWENKNTVIYSDTLKVDSIEPSTVADIITEQSTSVPYW